MPGDIKTSVWAPVHDSTENDDFLMEMSESIPDGIPPPAYEEEYTPPRPTTPVWLPTWTRLHSVQRDNFKNSPLLRLPEPFLVKIMTDYCDTEDVLRLRHTSRTFMRIFSQKQDFQPLWRRDRYCEVAHVWKTPNCTYPEQQPSFCKSCFEVRKVHDGELLEDQRHLWCTGCRNYHTELHFSHLQRAERDDERMCIGREGYVRLCDHLTINWAQVRTMAKWRNPGVTCEHNIKKGNSNVDCVNGGNCNSCGESANCAPCTNKNNKRVDCSHIKCQYNHRATFEVEALDDGRYKIQFNTATHIPFSRGPAGEKPSWFSVYKSIHEVLANPIDQRTFMPSRRFAGCDPMRVFDPNHCSCLDWDVSETEIKDSEPKHGFKWRLSDTRCGGWRHAAEEDEHAGVLCTATDPETDRCLGVRHGFNMVSGRRKIAIDFKQCADDGNMLVFEQTVRMIVEGPSDPVWEDLIEPSSIVHIADEEMLGKTWCYMDHTRDAHNCAVTRMKREGRSLREVEWQLLHPGPSPRGSDTSDAEDSDSDMLMTDVECPGHDSEGSDTENEERAQRCIRAQLYDEY